MPETKLPPLRNRRRFKYVNTTPDDEYPIRILKAYLLDARTEWETQGLPENQILLYVAMNENQAKRREILMKAIEKLST